MEPQFQFPFEPYEIQKKFMKELYKTIDKRELGIFESPTGTGKSLSICCAALQWLKDNNKNIIESLEKEIADLKQKNEDLPDADDWLQEEYHKIKINQTIANLQLKLDKLKKREDYFAEMQRRVALCKANTNKINHYFKKQKDSLEDKENSVDVNERDEDDLMIEDLDVKDEDSEPEDQQEDEESDPITKIYISSRTHSQLSQFVGEIKRTAFNNNVRVVTLASRQHYCINSEVNRLKSVHLINERCLDLQKSKMKSTLTDDDGKVLKKTKTKSCSGCPYYNQNNINKLKERLLVEIMDMEDIVRCGKVLKACPYYACRMALDEAEVVLVSHAGIVSGGARSGVSLKLKDNVLILDEAHGLTAALENAHSAPVTNKQLNSVKTYLNFYINRYRAKLSSKNLLLLNQLSFVVGKLLSILKPNENDANIFTLEDFVIKAEIDHLNLRPIVEFCKNTRLAPKLHGFSMRYSEQELEESQKKQEDSKKSFKNFLSNIAKKTEKEAVVEEKKEEKQIVQGPPETSAGGALYSVLSFLEALCERGADGRVLAASPCLRYLLLNPDSRFAPVVKECRSVVVAGGTMEPLEEFRKLLSDGERPIREVRCSHVVGMDRVLAVCLSRGPSDMTLGFTHENRFKTDLLDEVGRILRNICSIVPGGVVCFLPSYSYEQVVFEHMKRTNVIEAISKRKTVFREPKSAAEVDQVLQKYSAAINNKDSNKTGALLLSVVGGKLSEGLNFSDELGRCVVVLGLPYPNVNAPDLKEKMAYLERAAPGAGADYYDNLCMKAVNQCIGRAVRHAHDHAAVVLADARYSRARTRLKLPAFIQQSLVPNCGFGQAVGSMAKFFSNFKKETKGKINS